jgi:hypothetical protein
MSKMAFGGTSGKGALGMAGEATPDAALPYAAGG